MAAWLCSACGGENAEGMHFCGHCGTKRAGTAAAAATDVQEALRSFVAGPVADQLVETGGRLPEERRLITALFADVSGFTALADRLDPEQLVEVIDPVISALSSIVGRYDGYVEKFAGDALLALFGAPISHEDDADRALLVALEMHRELARLCAELPMKPDLTLHVGVNSGHGIARILGSEARMDYGVLGDSVILAQRLESSAPAGETYVSQMTVALTGERFEFEPVGDLTLKGKSQPVPALRLVGERRVPEVRRRPLIGRENELAAALAAVRTLSSGRGSVLAVTGEPGIGKSRLTDEVRAHAVVRGPWLHARCLSYGSGLAYWPYADLLQRVTGILPEDDPETGVRKLATAIPNTREQPYFAKLLGLPVADPDVVALEPEGFRRGLHDAFASWLRRSAEEGPVTVALEDFHWMDASSIELTAELVRITQQHPVLLCLIARPEAVERLEAIAPDRTSVVLEPLGEEGIRSLVESVLEGSAPRELVAFVAQRTGGNPFFIEETVRSMREAEALARDDGAWRIRPGWDARTLPETVEGVLAARFDLLPRPTAALVQTASVIGRRIALPLLHAVIGDAKLEERLEGLVASGFFDRSVEAGVETVVFHHALVQDAAYSRLLRRRRRELHLRVAEVAETLYGAGEDTIDLLARHLYLGEAGEKAVAYLLRAAERSKRLYANEEAILHLSRALELDSGDAEIRLDLADLTELVGDYDEALRLYTEVRDAVNDVRAWRGITSTLRKQGEYVRALDVVDTAFRTEGLAGADLAPLWLEQGWTLSVAGRFDQAIDVLSAGVTAAGERVDASVGHMLLQLARAKTVAGRFGEALDDALRAEQIFSELEDLRGLVTSYRMAGDTYRLLQRFDEAAATFRRGLELAERVGSAEEIGASLGGLGLVEMQRGALEDAVACHRRAIEEFERIGHAGGRAQSYANLAWALSEAGEYEEALTYCQKALDLARSIGHSLVVADVNDTMGSVKLGQGDYSAAGEWAEEAARLYLEIGAAPQAAQSFELAAKAWDRAGEKERARASRTRALDLAGEPA
jgi:class 3 adenylate cyclase/tetratricopeptide (TPR) repeat protein